MMDRPSTLFLTTRWTLVGKATGSGGIEGRKALGDLFKIYWKPLYLYARRVGRGSEDAEDLVQGFFAHLLEGEGLRLADRDRGRFRAFMLGALKHFMINDWRRGHRQKRGGFSPHLSLDPARSLPSVEADFVPDQAHAHASVVEHGRLDTILLLPIVALLFSLGQFCLLHTKRSTRIIDPGLARPLSRYSDGSHETPGPGAHRVW